MHRPGLSGRQKLGLVPAVVLYYPLMELALRPISASLEAELNPYAANADLIHNVRIGREGLSLASLRAARANDIPFVLTPVHHPRWKGWLYRVYLGPYRSADLIIALGRSREEDASWSGR